MRHLKNQFARKNAMMVEIGQMVPGFFTSKDTFARKSIKVREFLSGRILIGEISIESVETIKNKMANRKFADVAEFDMFVCSLKLTK